MNNIELHQLHSLNLKKALEELPKLFDLYYLYNTYIYVESSLQSESLVFAGDREQIVSTMLLEMQQDKNALLGEIVRDVFKLDPRLDILFSFSNVTDVIIKDVRERRRSEI